MRYGAPVLYAAIPKPLEDDPEWMRFLIRSRVLTLVPPFLWAVQQACSEIGENMARAFESIAPALNEFAESFAEIGALISRSFRVVPGCSGGVGAPGQ